MTTDTFPKGAVRRVSLGGKTVTLNGITKGSGMIAPDMATMLAFVFTDAAVPAAVLHNALRTAVRESFNAISVDGDTSTNDTVLAVATGAVDVGIATQAPRRRAFTEALSSLMWDLACQVVDDGEGSEKTVTIRVTGARTLPEARRMARVIADSLLVKTALAAGDCNWGRIVMAAGKSGAALDMNRFSIHIGGLTVAVRGARAADYDESAIKKHLHGHRVDVTFDAAVGAATARIVTCDLTHGYIKINTERS